MLSTTANYGLSIHLPGKTTCLEIQHPNIAIIAGPPHTPYSISVINNTGHQIFVVISIDGKSLVNTKQASATDEGIILDQKSRVELSCFLHSNIDTKEFMFKKLGKLQTGFVTALFYSAPEESDYMVQGYQRNGQVWVSSFIQRNTAPEEQITIYYHSPEQVMLKPPVPAPILFPGDV